MKQYIYEELAALFQQKILSNEWPDKTKIPSIRTLSSHYNVSKISVQNALHKLEAMGVLQARPKSGYYVVGVIPPENNLSKKAINIQPKLIDVPNIFHEIMRRSAAFDIYPLAKAQQPIGHLTLLNRRITREMRNHMIDNSLYYSPPEGTFELRQQICQHYLSRQLIVQPEDICITSGCQNSLFLALSTCCEPGDTVAIESPAFYGVLQLLQSLGLRVIEISASTTQGLSIDNLKTALQKWPIKACVLTPNFATPTGSCMPERIKNALYELSVAHQFIIIEDDIYGDLGFHLATHPLKKWDKQDNVILCSSVSKTLSRDLRIGWIISGKYQSKIVHQKLVNQLSNSQAIQQGLASFMAQGAYRRHLHQYKQLLKQQRDNLINAINTLWTFPFSYTVPDGGLCIWVALPQHIDTVELYHQALALNIIVTPGKLFSSSGDYGHYIRMSFVHAIENERLSAVEKLGQLITQLCHTTS